MFGFHPTGNRISQTHPVLQPCQTPHGQNNHSGHFHNSLLFFTLFLQLQSHPIWQNRIYCSELHTWQHKIAFTELGMDILPLVLIRYQVRTNSWTLVSYCLQWYCLKAVFVLFHSILTTQDTKGRAWKSITNWGDLWRVHLCFVLSTSHYFKNCCLSLLWLWTKSMIHL